MTLFLKAVCFFSSVTFKRILRLYITSVFPACLSLLTTNSRCLSSLWIIYFWIHFISWKEINFQTNFKQIKLSFAMHFFRIHRIVSWCCSCLKALSCKLSLLMCRFQVKLTHPYFLIFAVVFVHLSLGIMSQNWFFLNQSWRKVWYLWCD